MDTIFKALNDPARRALLDSLRARDGQTLTELEEQIDMTRFGVMKHLKVLEDAHLVIPRKQGRFKYHYLNALPLQEVIDRWIAPFLKPQAAALSELKAHLEGRHIMTKPDYILSTYIRCTQDALWEALTEADMMTKFHFMADRVERQGNDIIYHMPGGGVMLRMTETTVTPKSRIDATFEPSWEGPGMPTSRFTYRIEAEGDHCKLTVEHYDLVAAQTAGVSDGWNRMVSTLKSYLETGNAQPFRPEMAAAT
jgi:DNA-binding transcriptional ArsR family regulator